MNCPPRNNVMTSGFASCGGRGTAPVAPQGAPHLVAVNPYRFDPYGRTQGRTEVGAATQSIPAVAAFTGLREPVGQPIVSVPVPNVPQSAASAAANSDRTQRRSRRTRTLLCAGLASVLLLGFGGGVTAFAFEDADSRMPIVQEYEEMVTPDVNMTVHDRDGAEVVTILDDPTPMASSPEAQSSVADFAVDVEPAPVTDAAPAPLAGALEQAPVEEAPSPLAPYTLEINGTRVPYIHSVFATLCPDRNAALWAGSDDTTDGSFGYFIGHNPGDFACVYALVPGNYVTLCDANGNLRNYTVSKLYDIPNSTLFREVLEQLIPRGESLIMQTCIGDGSYYRIVVCQ